MTTEDAATRCNRRYLKMQTAIDDRDVKGVIKILTGLLFDAGADPETANYIHLCMQHLAASRRNWEDIATFGSRAITAAEKAERKGVSNANISFEKQHRDIAQVRCKQAESFLGKIPAGALWHHRDETKAALESVRDHAIRYIEVLEKDRKES